MKYKNIFSIIIIFLVVLFNSVIYGALNTEMYIDGEAQVRVDRDIRITNLKVVEQTAGAYEKYSSSYSKNLTSMHVVLPNSNSTMTYEVDISNTGYAKYKVNDIVEEINSNNKIKYEIINLDQSTIIENGATYTFKIKFTTLENDVNTQGTFTLKYIFKMYVLTPLYNMVTENLKSLDTNLDFAESPTVETSGLFEIDSTKNDEYPVYYYRGIVGNNNVKFANICWKILRTTSTGGIKLIYNGIPKIDGSCNNLGVDTHISTGQFNSNNSTMEDVSYIYKDGRDSLIKTTIDNWYNDNLIDYTNALC